MARLLHNKASLGTAPQDAISTMDGLRAFYTEGVERDSKWIFEIGRI